VCLKQVSALDTSWLVVDRTPFLTMRGPSRISVEHVPPSIYSASYPSWIFAWHDVAAWAGRPIAARWRNTEPEGGDYRYEGFLADPVNRRLVASLRP
jgi:hypothetical protein